MWEAVEFLFPPFVACFSIIIILCYFGIHVLEREIIFIDITLAQITAAGSALAVTLVGHHSAEENSYIPIFFALGLTILASALFSNIGKRVTHISIETVIGVIYAIAAAGTLFLFGIAAGGDIHVEEMLTGNILWATWPDIAKCTLIYCAVGFFHLLFLKKFRYLSRNHREIMKTDRSAVWWDFLFYLSMGVVITYTVAFAGVLVTFAYLVIPATFSAMLSRKRRNRMVTAWIMAIIATIGGLALSYRFDFSCGPSIVSLLGIILIFAAFIAMLKPRKNYKHHFIEGSKNSS